MVGAIDNEQESGHPLSGVSWGRPFEVWDASGAHLVLTLVTGRQ